MNALLQDLCRLAAADPRWALFISGVLLGGAPGRALGVERSMAGRVMVATAPPRPLALLRPSTVYSPHSAAAVVGISESTIRNQLRAAPLDGHRRVTEGPWAGAYRRGAHWRIPAQVVQRVSGVQGQGRDDGLRREVCALRVELESLKRLLGSLFGSAAQAMKVGTCE
jgi:hypothetical protein